MTTELFTLRKISVILMISSIALVGLQMYYLQTLGDMSEQSCTCGDFCSMIPFEIHPLVYVGFIGIFLIFLIGAVLYVKKDSIADFKKDKQMWEQKLKTLEQEEKEIYQLLMGAEGTMFQAEIVEKTGWTKVKVTRTLDSLESRRLVERRRRGLTNIIVLKT